MLFYFALCTYAYKITCMLYDKNDLFSRLYNNYMYILLHTYMLLPCMCF